MMTFKLPDSIASPQDLIALQLELHEYAKWYMHESIKKHVEAKNGSSMPVLSSPALACLRAWHSEETLSPGSLEALVKQLELLRTNARVISLTLAAPVTGVVRKILVSWCRDNIAPNILVNFQFNSTLLGGMVVRYGSRVFDWSFRRQILNAHTTFPEVLRRV
jgi:hypothetical protein